MATKRIHLLPLAECLHWNGMFLFICAASHLVTFVTFQGAVSLGLAAAFRTRTGLLTCPIICCRDEELPVRAIPEPAPHPPSEEQGPCACAHVVGGPALSCTVLFLDSG